MVRRSMLGFLGLLGLLVVPPLTASPLPVPIDGTPIRGLWWNPDRPGQGLDLHRSPGTLDYTVLWYGHDGGGEPTWYLGNAILADSRLDFELLRITWPPSMVAAAGEVAGSLSVTFDDHENATLAWNLPERSVTERMVPFAFATGVADRNGSGLWASLTDPGWGLSIATQGVWTVAIQYYFDPAGLPRWVIGQGDDPARPLTLLTIAAPDGNGSVQGTPVGTLNLGFSDLARLAVEGDLPAWPVAATLDRLTEPLVFDHGSSVESDAPLAFVGVNVLPMDTPAVLTDQVVATRAGHIEAIAPRSRAVVPQGSTLLRATDAWLMPGLVDSHVHFIVAEAHFENDLFTILANGVTTMRQLWGQAGIRELRDAIDDGEIVGPRILTASPGIEGPQSYWPQTIVVSTPAEARVAVREAAAAGFDFIKVYSRLSLANYEAILEEANAAGIPVVGHVSGQVGVMRAMTGHHSIEHLDGYPALITSNGAASWAAPLSAARVSELARATAAAGVWNVPTQVVIERSRGDIDRIRNSRDWRLLSPEYRGWFDDPLTQPGSPPAFALDNRLTMIRALWEAGAPLAVGTDSGVQYVLPGPSIHEEMARFRAAGIPAFATLQAATRNGADLLGQADHFGRVARGLSADLLLLADDPRADPSTLTDLQGLMLRGRWWSRAAIDARLDEIEASYPPGPD